ncbi:uncharacterized protein [Dermacentor albipictus]|uniref:uncharacterized protein n=1 Tax=Dermacentor albipictus TaxID=60249 RepID=UPI0038FD13BE
MERRLPPVLPCADVGRIYHEMRWAYDFLPRTWHACTDGNSRNRPCPLVQDALLWNIECRQVGVEIREDDRSPGKLCVLFDETYEVCSREEILHHQLFLSFLLQEHRCIESVTLSRPFTFGHDQRFFNALRANGRVRRLSLLGPTGGTWGLCNCRQHFVDALSGMLKLQELIISEDVLGHDARMHTFVDYLANTTSLQVLDLTQSALRAAARCALYRGLLGNRSLKSLTLRHFYAEREALKEAVFACLHGHATLESLTVHSDGLHSSASLDFVARCAVANRGPLRRLRLVGWPMDLEAAASIGQLFSGDCTLESFAFVPPRGATDSFHWPAARDALPPVGHDLFPFAIDRGSSPPLVCEEGVRSILHGIGESRSLREVSFSLSGFTASGCELLVGELLRCSRLRKITLEPRRFDAVRAICQELRDKGHARDLLPAGRRDVSGTLLPQWVRDRLQCSRLVLDHSRIWREDVERCPRGIYVMPSFETVTSLCVREVAGDFLNNGTCRLMAEYLARTTELRELNVAVTGYRRVWGRPEGPAVSGSAAAHSLAAFVDSLVANGGVTRVFLAGLPLADEACRALARALRSGWRVYDLTLLHPTRAVETFFSALMEPPGLKERNRSLTNLHVRCTHEKQTACPHHNPDASRHGHHPHHHDHHHHDHQYHPHHHDFLPPQPTLREPPPVTVPAALADVVRRNCNVATLAARHVTGRKAGARCADALHQIARADRFAVCERNPGLVAKVQELALLDIDHDCACQMIRDSARSLLTLDGYMRTAGVVRRTVECHPDPNGRKQLPDIGDDIWAFVRRYLRVADVL